MKFDYTTIRQAVYNTIIAEPNNRFVFNDDDRYINQIKLGRIITNPPFPAILIYSSRKTERHETIGYAPTPYIYMNIRIVDRFPNSQEPPALATALGLSDNRVITEEESDKVLDLILDTLEEWLRGDNTVEGRERRKLNLPDRVIIALPMDANWGIDSYQNLVLRWVDLTLEIRLNRLT